jgi:hypothetical protein
MNRKLPSARLLRRLIEYNPQTGEMWWKERPVWMFRDNGQGRKRAAAVWSSRYAGTRALNSVHIAGYLEGRIFKKACLAHRVIWTLVRGEWPPKCIDHINGDRADNRIKNLRTVSRGENQKNMRQSVRNTSGITGVRFDKPTSKWRAVIRASGRQTHLGLFDTKAEAARARAAAEVKYGYHPNHGRPRSAPRRG